MSVRVMSLLLMASLLSLGTFGPVVSVGLAEPGGSNEDIDARGLAVNISVFYATNRRRHEGKPPSDTYGGERGEPHFGHCEVAFTAMPLMGGLARKVPFYVPSETSEVRVAEQADPETFWERLSTAAGRASSGSVVVFVHGYNYGFDRTCRMAAAMQRVLEGRAAVVMFSWPSNGLPTDYVRDQADVEWSVPYLADFLATLGDRVGPANVQVLAHSLGSRGVIFALERLRADQGVREVVGRLVLLAPDFDSQTFVDLLPVLSPQTGGVTLYASSNDAPLKVSQKLSGYPRLGEGGEFLTLVAGIETIDVSPTGRYQILGHEYFYYHPLVVADLVELLSTGHGAAQRPGLRPKSRDGTVYWEIAGVP